jgi:Tfp pilus assembly protein PilF
MDEFSVFRAKRLLAAGLDAVKASNLKLAAAKFQASAECVPTAEALTYWGWMEHHLGNTKKAIELCHRAIELDPAFGNPYNDIGSYLVALGDADEAIAWFEKAIVAPKYEPRQFPHINLGRVYLSKEMPGRALVEFRKALDFSPHDRELLALIQNLEKTLH